MVVRSTSFKKKCDALVLLLACLGGNEGDMEAEQLPAEKHLGSD